MDSVGSQEVPVRPDWAGDALAWLVDAPLFMDAKYVGAFYDGVVRPETEELTTRLELSISDSTIKTWAARLGVEASLGKILAKLLPGLPSFKVEGELEKGGEKSHSESQTVVVELQPIKTPHRQLVHLILYYLSLPDRLRVVQPEDEEHPWLSDEYILESPRPLVLLDLPPGTILVPTAAEVASGQVVTFFDQISLAFAKPGKEFPPEYVEPQQGKELSEVHAENIKYWDWFRRFFAPGKAMRVVEAKVGDRGPIAWIDYRLPIRSDGTTLHLHICGRGEFDTGVFAYNLIKRGYKHGLRVIGTLKTEPDMNVLAVFEK